MKHDLILRLREKIDPKRSVIDVHNSVSNIGLRMIANKLDAVGEALAELLEERAK